MRGGTDDATLRMMSGQGKEVLVLLPNDDEFLREMQAYMKIESFLRKNTNAHLSQYESIKEAKRTEMRKRNEKCQAVFDGSIERSYHLCEWGILRG